MKNHDWNNTTAGEEVKQWNSHILPPSRPLVLLRGRQVQEHSLKHSCCCLFLFSYKAYLLKEFYLFIYSFIYSFIYLFIYGCIGSLLLHAGFLQLQRAGAILCCGARASHCGGFPCCRAQALGTRASVVVARGLWSTGAVVVAHGLSCSATCGIFLDQGSNPCPLHWQVDS